MKIEKEKAIKAECVVTNEDLSLLTFNEIEKRSAKILEKMEAGKTDMQEAIMLYEQGIALTEEAARRLSAAKKKIEECNGKVNNLLEMLDDDEN